MNLLPLLPLFAFSFLLSPESAADPPASYTLSGGKLGDRSKVGKYTRTQPANWTLNHRRTVNPRPAPAYRALIPITLIIRQPHAYLRRGTFLCQPTLTGITAHGSTGYQATCQGVQVYLTQDALTTYVSRISNGGAPILTGTVTLDPAGTPCLHLTR